MVYERISERTKKIEKLKADLGKRYRVFWKRGQVAPCLDKELIDFCLEYMGAVELSTNENARLMGELLELVKQRLPHGKFMRWVEDNCPFSARAAQNFILLYQVTLDNPELICLKKSVIYLIASKSFTKELRERLAEVAVGCYDITLKEVLLLKTKLDNGEVSPDSVELSEFFKKRKEIDLENRIRSEKERLLAVLEKERQRYQKFTKELKEAIGNTYKQNEYAIHSKYVTEVLEQAKSSLHRGCSQNTESGQGGSPVQAVQVQLSEGSDGYTLFCHDEIPFNAEILSPDDFHNNDEPQDAIAAIETYYQEILCPDDFTGAIGG